MRNTTGLVLRRLRARLASLPPEAAELARVVLESEADIYKKYEYMRDGKVTARRGRAHGNLHLGRVLFTGKDFVIVDFEGDRAKQLSERRRKRSPLRDVASMIVSLHAAAFSTLLEEAVVRPADRPIAVPWGLFWHRWASASFLRSYIDSAAGLPYVPSDGDELRNMLDSFILERALADLGAALDDRPAWAAVFLHLIADVLGESVPFAGFSLPPTST
jgi:maltose alpha-D-glucosyltransferase/alpha-amylase